MIRSELEEASLAYGRRLLLCLSVVVESNILKCLLGCGCLLVEAVAVAQRRAGQTGKASRVEALPGGSFRGDDG
jgi:hypothetical protein